MSRIYFLSVLPVIVNIGTQLLKIVIFNIVNICVTTLVIIISSSLVRNKALKRLYT